MLTSFIFSLLIGCHNPSEEQIVMYHTLAVEAPETVVAPYYPQFVNEDYYNIAVEKYERLGHWATPDNGISFKQCK